MPIRSGLLCVLFSLVLISAAPAAEAPSIGKAESDFNSGDYRASLAEISRLLTTNAARPGTQARYDAFMLRGECMLRLKMPEPAQQAFIAASRVVKQDADTTGAATAEGLAILVKKSQGLMYTPAHGSPIDIVDPEHRKEALAALYADLAAAIKPRVQKAMQDTSLKPLHDLIPAVFDVYNVEVAATGKATQTEGMAKAMGEHAARSDQFRIQPHRRAHRTIGRPC